MTINLANFQLNAIKSLLESMDEPCREIVLKSPTGSGKTLLARTLAKIRILCNAVTKVAVALYHKLKGIPHRSKGGDGYDR